jgi:hypothetical protein
LANLAARLYKKYTVANPSGVRGGWVILKDRAEWSRHFDSKRAALAARKVIVSSREHENTINIYRGTRADLLSDSNRDRSGSGFLGGRATHTSLKINQGDCGSISELDNRQPAKEAVPDWVLRFRSMKPDQRTDFIVALQAYVKSVSEQSAESHPDPEPEYVLSQQSESSDSAVVDTGKLENKRDIPTDVVPDWEEL